MIVEEFYHFSRGSKVKLYHGATKFFLCRHQSYQSTIRTVVMMLFYIPSLPLSPADIMDVVLGHCKNRLDFTAFIFRNVPLSLCEPLTNQLVLYTEKQITLLRGLRASRSNHGKERRMESTGKQIEIMKRIFRLSPCGIWNIIRCV